MELFDFLGIGQPDWVDGEEKISKMLSEHLAKNNPSWAQLSLKEQQERLANLMGKFSNRIEWFLMETMGKPAFVNEFAFRFVGRPDIPEELKDRVLNIGIQNNTAIEIEGVNSFV